MVTWRRSGVQLHTLMMSQPLRRTVTTASGTRGSSGTGQGGSRFEQMQWSIASIAISSSCTAAIASACWNGTTSIDGGGTGTAASFATASQLVPPIRAK